MDLLEHQAERNRVAETPDFAGSISRLETMAYDGIDTPDGNESFLFRASFELEFAFFSPEGWRAKEREIESESFERFVRYYEGLTIPEAQEIFAQNFIQDADRDRKLRHDKIRNPELINGEMSDTTELITELQAYTTGFVNRLPAKNEAEEQKRQKWLEEIPDFGVRELINFLVYEEFSVPTLADTSPPKGAPLDILDEHSDRTGWLEFKFGTGNLQSGYYDSPNMCEVRLNPCEPNEAVRRRQIILDRMVELSNQFGLLLQTDSGHEHLNLSVYQKDCDGNFQPIIGQSEERREQTLDVAAGIARTYHDGIWLHPDNMQWEYIFEPAYESSRNNLVVSPVRRGVRIKEDLLELRTKFKQADQAVNWMMASAIMGLQHGHEAIAQTGVEIPEVQTVYQVHRTEAFDKHTDIDIQRAFEDCEIIQAESGERLYLNTGFNMVYGEDTITALLGEQEDAYGCDVFNDAIFLSTIIDTDGTPVVQEDLLLKQYMALNDEHKLSIAKFLGSDWNNTLTKINERFETVRLLQTEAIVGSTSYVVSDRQDALDRLGQSETAQLAYGDQAGQVTAWLVAAIPEKVSAN